MTCWVNFGHILRFFGLHRWRRNQFVNINSQDLSQRFRTLFITACLPSRASDFYTLRRRFTPPPRRLPPSLSLWAFHYRPEPGPVRVPLSLSLSRGRRLAHLIFHSLKSPPPPRRRRFPTTLANPSPEACGGGPGGAGRAGHHSGMDGRRILRLERP